MENSPLKIKGLWAASLIQSVLTASLVLAGGFYGYNLHKQEIDEKEKLAPKPLWQAEMMAQEKTRGAKFSPQEANAAYEVLTSIRRISTATSSGITPADFKQLVFDSSADAYKNYRLVPAGAFKESAAEYLMIQNDASKYWMSSISSSKVYELDSVPTAKNSLTYYGLKSGLSHDGDSYADITEEDRTMLIQKIWEKASESYEKVETGFIAQIGDETVKQK